MRPPPAEAKIDVSIPPGSASMTSGGNAMEWWQWLVLVIGVLVLVTAVFYGVQLRRRSGGIVAQRSRRGRRSG
jgi:hypothetical protein